MFLAPALLTALAASWIEAMGDHSKAHLHRLVVRSFHGGHRHGSAIEVQAQCLNQGILSHGELCLASPLQLGLIDPG